MFRHVLSYILYYANFFICMNLTEFFSDWKGNVFSKLSGFNFWITIKLHTVHKKGDKTDRKNCCGIALLSTSYKILLNILPSRLSLYID
jgi:hypothetical protein